MRLASIHRFEQTQLPLQEAVLRGQFLFSHGATFSAAEDTNLVKEVKRLSAQGLTPFFEALYEQTYNDTLLYLTRRCSDPAQLPDLVQEIYAELYVVLLQKGTGYLRDPKAFVRHLAKSKLRQYYTLRSRLAALLPLQKDDDDGQCYDTPELAECALNEPLPERLVENRLLAAQLAEALKACPADVQKIFICHFQLDMTLPATARALGMKESTVKTKLYRTLAKLRKLYAKDGADDE